MFWPPKIYLTSLHGLLLDDATDKRSPASLWHDTIDYELVYERRVRWTLEFNPGIHAPLWATAIQGSTALAQKKKRKKGNKSVVFHTSYLELNCSKIVYIESIKFRSIEWHQVYFKIVTHWSVCVHIYCAFVRFQKEKLFNL